MSCSKRRSRPRWHWALQVEGTLHSLRALWPLHSAFPEDLLARLLGLDVGDRRIGLALTDPLEIAASPHGTLERTNQAADIAQLAKLVADREVRAVVVGLPLRTDGKPSEQAERVRTFAAKLQEALSVPVIETDERLTTQQARRALLSGDVSRQGRKTRVDKVAAAFILQHYLDSNAT